MFLFIRILINIILILSPFIIIFRLLKKKKTKKDSKKNFVFSKKRGKGKLIWFHGASVGEILSIYLLSENLRKKNL